MIIHDSQVVTLIFDANIHCLKLVWHDFADEEQHKKLFEALYEFVQNNKSIRGIIIDSRKGKVISPKSQEWFMKELYPLLIKENNTYQFAVAFINSESNFRKLYNNKLMSFLEKDLKVGLFETEQTAIRWIKSLINSKT